MPDPAETETLAVRHSLVVSAPPERAFAVFTDGFATWWPLSTHHIGAVEPETTVIEPREGGRWYERAPDGTELLIGSVKAWDPPARLELSWELGTDYRHDPAIDTRVEVRFTPDAGGGTRVELEHRGLEAYGDEGGRVRDTFDAPGGWPGLLERFAATAGGEGA
jgi:uncharacterized protein YndB with AHSA1/START domain